MVWVSKVVQEFEKRKGSKTTGAKDFTLLVFYVVSVELFKVFYSILNHH